MLDCGLDHMSARTRMREKFEFDDIPSVTEEETKKKEAQNLKQFHRTDFCKFRN